MGSSSLSEPGLGEIKCVRYNALRINLRSAKFQPQELQVKIVFHVGAHKTGSTLIQNALKSNIGLLRDAGWGYKPKAHWIQKMGQTPADFYIQRRRERDLAKARDSLMRFLDAHDADNVVMSSEGTLASPDPSRPHFLASPANPGLYLVESDSVIDWYSEVFSGLDLTMVFYARRQDSFLDSLYLENLRQGRRVGKKSLLQLLDTDRLSWRPVLQRLKEEFNLEVRCFESIRTAGSEAFVRDFFQVLDESLGEQVEVPANIVNISLRDPFLQLAEGASRLFKTKNSKVHKKFVKQILEVQMKALDITERPKIFGNSILGQIEQRYQQDNVAVVEEYLSGLSAQHHADFLWH
jgi:hypothetical protein